jgi:hypothetical protein
MDGIRSGATEEKEKRKGKLTGKHVVARIDPSEAWADAFLI